MDTSRSRHPARVASIALALMFLFGAPVVAGGIRYINATPGGPAEYTLWTSHAASTNCGRALLYGYDARQWCEEGVAGARPRIGTLSHGTEVEVLDDAECRDMIHARVLTGPLRGEVGCLVARALSPSRPELPGAP